MAGLKIAKRFAAILAAIVLLAISPVLTLTAGADEITWRMKSSHHNVVSVKFYSQSRNAVWPGSDEVYIIDDDRVQTYRLSCRSGEKICYGAWVRNRSEEYWGVGQDDEQGCDECCRACEDGGRTEIIDLLP
jgi:hypothetical protein